MVARRRRPLCAPAGDLGKRERSVVINEIAIGGRAHTPTTTPVYVYDKPLSQKYGLKKVLFLNGVYLINGNVPKPKSILYDINGRMIKRIDASGFVPDVRRDFGVYIANPHGG